MPIVSPAARPRQLNCRMPPDTWQRLHAEAMRRRTSITELAREILDRAAAKLPPALPPVHTEANAPEI